MCAFSAGSLKTRSCRVAWRNVRRIYPRLARQKDILVLTSHGFARPRLFQARVRSDVGDWWNRASGRRLAAWIAATVYVEPALLSGGLLRQPHRNCPHGMVRGSLRIATPRATADPVALAGVVVSDRRNGVHSNHRTCMADGYVFRVDLMHGRKLAALLLRASTIPCERSGSNRRGVRLARVRAAKTAGALLAS